jgi:hypothetical protein
LQRGKGYWVTVKPSLNQIMAFYKIYLKLYESTVWLVIAYWAASLWVYVTYINTMRLFLGVGKYTPDNAMYGEFGWLPPNLTQ